MEDRQGIRCSDGEREQTRLWLAEAAGEGRITVGEAEERLALVAAARYRHELHEVTADLPRRVMPADQADGWLPVLTSANRQLSADAATLLGQGRGVVNRRLAILVAVLAAVLILAALFFSALHGFGDDGFEHHGLDRD
jgi:hypothetical protein